MTDTRRLIAISIFQEVDVVTCRQTAKSIAAWLGLTKLEQIRIATSVSELARNVYQYAGRGTLQFALRTDAQGLLAALAFEIRDFGKGIPHLEHILDGSYQSPTGMGVGLRGAQKLMDEFHIETSDRGTLITGGKRIHPPRPFPGDAAIRALTGQLQAEGPTDPYQELKEQATELLLTTGELQSKKEELEATNLELENTNKGVVALYSELEKTAQELKDASESKNRFFSNMTHEFRTPLNIIENISRLLLDGVDGALNPEQQKQVRFISDAAIELSELVNELLDLAEAQSGRLEVVPDRFELSAFMEQVRQFTAALARRYPQLSWEIPPPLRDVSLHTDRNRLFQILRNLIGNAFKYTPAGSVRIQVFQPDDATLEFMVEDTGIGISEEDQTRIFEEFCRLRTPGLGNVQGTGLGLPLAQQLAGLLKGSISLTSTPEKGSRFFLQLPRAYDRGATSLNDLNFSGVTVLVIDDNEADRYLIRRTLEPYGAVILEAATASESIDKLYAIRPDVIFLDLELPDISGDELLQSMDWNIHSKVLINTAKQLSEGERARLEPLCHAILTKAQPAYPESVLQGVQRVIRSHHAH